MVLSEEIPGLLKDTRKTKAQLIEELEALRTALDAVQDGFIVFDAEDRVVAFNAKQMELFPSIASLLAIGMPYRELLEAQIAHGQIDAARGREREWIEARVTRHLNPDGVAREQIFADGRVIRLSEHRTPSGGIVAIRRDITDHKATQQSLRENDRRLHDFAETSTDWFWETDELGRIVWESENHQYSLGRSFKDIEGMTREEIAGDTMPPELWQPYREALEQHQDVENFEYGFRGLDGLPRFVRINGRPRFDLSGKYIGHRGIGSDVSERRLAEKARQDSENQYRDLAQLNPDAFIIQVGGRIVFANEAARRIFAARTVDQLIGMDSLDVVHPDHKDEMLIGRQQAMQGGGNLPHREYHHLRLDGTSFPSEVVTGPIEWEGEIGTMNIVRDLSSQKRAEKALQESEKRFRAIADGSPVPLVITRREGGEILYANGQVEPVLGWTAEEIIGENITKYFWNPSIREGRAEIVDEKGYVDQSIVDMRRRDGTKVPTTHSLRSIEFDGVPAIMGAFTDVTQQQNVEMDLRQAKEVAEAADASKTQFLAVMSHELRTPLNAIIGFSELMSQEVFGSLGHERYADYANDIQQSGRHLLALISDILDLSRIESGHLELEEVEFELADVIAECTRYIQGRAVENGITIKTHLPQPSPRLLADRRQTKQIALNLLTNAVKFSKPDTVVEIRADTSAAGELLLCVSDQGAGIPAGDLERVMEPFTRLEGTHTSRVDGTGLGLAIVKRLIEGHGGSLRLNSEVGRGTEAVVSFPQSRLQCGADGNRITP